MGLAVISIGQLVEPGLARAAPPPSSRWIAALPLDAVNLTEHQKRAVVRAFDQRLRELRGVRRLDPGRVTRAIDAVGCAQRCPERLGRRLGVGRLLMLSVGRLGDTYVMRLTLYDARRGARRGSWQEVLRTIEGRALSSALDRLLVGVAPPTQRERSTPWYRRWWVWTAAGIVVAGVVTTSVLLATQSSGPDRIITPPAP